MKASTEQLVSALRMLSVEIHSEDGVANAVIAEAADRMTLLANLVARHVEETREDTKQMQTACETMVEATAKIQNLRARIKRLEEAGARMFPHFSRRDTPHKKAVADQWEEATRK